MTLSKIENVFSNNFKNKSNEWEEGMENKRKEIYCSVILNHEVFEEKTYIVYV